jgi:hypothetical protein
MLQRILGTVGPSDQEAAAALGELWRLTPSTYL